MSEVTEAGPCGKHPRKIAETPAQAWYRAYDSPNADKDPMQHCPECDREAALRQQTPRPLNGEEISTLLENRFGEASESDVVWLTSQLNKLIEAHRSEASQPDTPPTPAVGEAATLEVLIISFEVAAQGNRNFAAHNAFCGNQEGFIAAQARAECLEWVVKGLRRATNQRSAKADNSNRDDAQK